MSCKTPPCTKCSPHLYSDEKNSFGNPKFESTCALVLAALGSSYWSGRWALDEKEAASLLTDIEEATAKTRGRSAQVDNHITLTELKAYVKDESNAKKILKLSSAVHGLCRPQFLERVDHKFYQFDKDCTADLDLNEWNRLLEFFARCNLEYLLGIAFQEFRAFFGRGQAWGLHPQDFNWTVVQQDLLTAAGSFGKEAANLDHAVKRLSSQNEIRSMSLTEDQSRPLASDEDLMPALPKCFQVGFDLDCDGWNPIPQGWLKDLLYYSANNHPLHGILMCDPIHPLSWIERVWMEVATMGFTTFTAALQDRWVNDNLAPVQFLSHPVAFGLVMVTIPGMVIWWTLFLLFTCKCGQVNEAMSTEDEIERGRKLTCGGATMAYVLCTLGLACLVHFFVTFEYRMRDVRILCRLVLMSRIKSYIISWVMFVFMYFNPLVAWGTPDPTKPQTGLGDLIGLGQWRIEKQRFQVKCVIAAHTNTTERQQSEHA